MQLQRALFVGLGRMSEGPARTTYRHGALREAAIAAAMRLVCEGGEPALTLRRVAEAVGVAHRSLYNHFADREALADAVAEAGFAALAARLRAAATRADFVREYVRFVLDNLNLYRLMKSQPLAVIEGKPALREAIRLTAAESARLFCDREASAQDNRRIVVKVLMLLYGGISLYLEGLLDVAGEDELIAELQSMIT
jgi:AcrR family transcriptional regulator